jgi:hypothetical protein
MDMCVCVCMFMHLCTYICVLKFHEWIPGGGLHKTRELRFSRPGR